MLQVNAQGVKLNRAIDIDTLYISLDFGAKVGSRSKLSLGGF